MVAIFFCINTIYIYIFLCIRISSRTLFKIELHLYTRKKKRTPTWYTKNIKCVVVSVFSTTNNQLPTVFFPWRDEKKKEATKSALKGNSGKLLLHRARGDWFLNASKITCEWVIRKNDKKTDHGEYRRDEFTVSCFGSRLNPLSTDSFKLLLIQSKL